METRSGFKKPATNRQPAKVISSEKMELSQASNWRKERYGIYVGLLAFFVYLVYSSFQKNPSPVIDLSTGKVQGVVSYSRNGREFYEFLGIPYAAPPIGNLRFQSPQPPLKWDGVLQANRDPPACMQIELLPRKLIGSEDCLYLNVFTPKARPGVERGLLPVMVYIHGGGFISGHAKVYKAKYLMDEDVVTVVIQYRLGVFGFLNTGDKEARGNQGLKDQVVALEWVQENIVNFGGDPGKVTLFGESAGGAAVHFHILSHRSKGLFQKAISQSGTSLLLYCFNDHLESKIKELSTFTKCPSDNSREFVRCLRNINAVDLVEIQRRFTGPPRNPDIMFLPSRERIQDADAFLTEKPLEILQKGAFNKVPWITGVNADEGMLLSAELYEHPPRLLSLEEDWNRVNQYVMVDGNETILNSLKNFYLPEKYNFDDISYDNLIPFTQMMGDRVFMASNHIAALEHAKHAPTYLYHFSHVGQISIIEVMRAVRADGSHMIIEFALLILKNFVYRYFGLDPRVAGISHSEELLIQFPFLPLPHIDQPSEDSHDFVMSRSLLRTWAEFAHDASELKFHNVTWTPVDPDHPIPHYMNLNITNPGMTPEPFAHRIQFWKSLGRGNLALYFDRTK